MNGLVKPPLEEAWPHVEPHIREISDRYLLPWTPEDVYAACQEGRAALFTSTFDESFTVVRPRIDQRTGEPYLFIWIAWSPGRNGIDAFTPDVHELARSIGAEEIRMESTRRGFERKGWEPIMTTDRQRVSVE